MNILLKIEANFSHPLRNVAGRLTPVTRWGVMTMNTVLARNSITQL
jgi:hypothetical protein